MQISRVTVLFSALLLLGADGDYHPRNHGTDVHVQFRGLICHVFDAQHVPRAVLPRGTESMPHRARIMIPERTIVSSDIPLDCGDGTCTLALENVALRFPRGGRATFEPGGSFDTIVPHLRAVTDGEMSDLRTDIFDEVPSPGGPMTAYLELPDGSLTTEPFAAMARYEPDYENRGLRPFPNGVFLDGHIAQPVLLIRRAGDAAWNRIRFRGDATIDIAIENEPAEGMRDSMHASLYYGLSKVPLIHSPVINVSANRRPVATDGLSPGCSNTQWP